MNLINGPDVDAIVVYLNELREVRRNLLLYSSEYNYIILILWFMNERLGVVSARKGQISF